ncbi:hypothetical protein MANES_08G155711v8 [Manihot esculenta]|uniref:Uncharacterized protein n=1 Tax=Manihot esculenta TaxID=3983 RepID=A0ACB7HD91_MANES|nr:hypothetical protein MANES_08G155711v8 [Manihot esculenta]
MASSSPITVMTTIIVTAIHSLGFFSILLSPLLPLVCNIINNRVRNTGSHAQKFLSLILAFQYSDSFPLDLQSTTACLDGLTVLTDKVPIFVHLLRNKFNSVLYECIFMLRK